MIVNTITFSEKSKGWTSFWDYEPTFAFSINGRYFTTNGGSVYEHYAGTVHGSFYEAVYPSTVSVVLNENPSIPKNFKTVNYEGSNGWEVSEILSDEFKPSSNEFGNSASLDSATAISSYSEGKYLDGGVSYRSGFDRKENKYYANIKSNGVIIREGEVLTSDKTSGIKGFYCTVTFKTDETTDIGGNKQLFSVSSEYVQSS